MEKQNNLPKICKDDTLMDRQETAKFLKISLATLWRYTRTKQLPYYKIGARILFSKREILATMRVPSKSEEDTKS
jgi:excisionase family DNA binding protein